MNSLPTASRLVRAYAREDVRERLLMFASKAKRRADLLAAIHTSDFLEVSARVTLTPQARGRSREESIGLVQRQMTELGASDTTYCLSLIKAIDGKTIPLVTALEACFMMTVETVLFDPVSEVGYFEGGHPDDRCILRVAGGAAL